MDTSTLSKLYAVEGPFVSIYLETSSEVENAASHLETTWKNVVRDLQRAGVDAATRDALSAARGAHGRGGNRVMVAAHGTVHLALSLPQPPAREEAVVGPLPRLVPLLDAVGVQVPHLVVLADRKGADVLAYTAGPDPVETGRCRATGSPTARCTPAGGPRSGTATTSRKRGSTAPVMLPGWSTVSRVTSTPGSSSRAATSVPCSSSERTCRPGSPTAS